MTELGETTSQTEVAKPLADQVTRQLILIKGRSGLLIQDMDAWVVKNQAQFGRGTDNYEGMVQAHQNTNVGLEAKVLGIHEEVRKRRTISVGGQETEFVEATPQVKNVWVGQYVKLMTPEEAAKTPFGGQNALSWATVNKVSPEMVVKASNGYFYPATKNDIVVAPTK